MLRGILTCFLEVLDYQYLTFTKQIEDRFTKKLTTPKTEPDSPLSHHCWPQASLAGAKPSLIFTEFAGAAGGGEDAGAGASEPLNVEMRRNLSGGAAFQLCSASP